MDDLRSPTPADWAAIWILGAPSACDQAVVECLRHRLLHNEKDQLSSSQIWWEGQLVGQCLNMYGDDEWVKAAVLPLLSTCSDLSMVSFSRFSTAPSLSRIEIQDQSNGQSWTVDVEDLPDGGFEHVQAYRPYVDSGRLGAFLRPTLGTTLEALAVAPDLAPFHQELRTTRWTEETAEVWWRCSENWLRSTSFVGMTAADGSVPTMFPFARIQEVLTALGTHAPSASLDIDRAIEFGRKGMANENGRWVENYRNPMFASVRGHLSANWLCGVMGDNAAWDGLNMQLSFSNTIQGSTVDWFKSISLEQQFQALNRALEESQAVLQYGVTPYARGVGDQVADFFQACPTWEPWVDVLADLVLSRRVPASVVRLEQRLRAGHREETLDHALPVSPVTSRPKPRF